MFDERDVVSSYGIEQAVADGIMIQPYPEKWPWLCVSIGVWAAIEDQNDGRTMDQKLIPFLTDVIMFVQAKHRRNNQDPETEWFGGLDGNVTGRDVWFSVNDKGGLSVYFPEER